MPSSGLYKSLTTDDAPIRELGFLKAWMNLTSDFTTIQEPVLTSPTPLIGEKYTIATQHVWAVGKEPLRLLVKTDTLEGSGKSNGEVGSLSMMYNLKIYVLGDGPIIQEMVENAKNEDLIFFAQNNCDVDANILQYGCDCDSAKIQNVTQLNGTRIGGQTVGWELEVRAFCRYFYTGGGIVDRA